MGTMDDADFFGEFTKRVASKRNEQRTVKLAALDLSALTPDHQPLRHHSQSAMTTLLGHLFVFYYSKFAHSFLAKDSEFNFILQEVAVKVLVSSALEQHVLKYIWNEAKVHGLDTATATRTPPEDDRERQKVECSILVLFEVKMK